MRLRRAINFVSGSSVAWFHSKFAGPVKHSVPDSDTVVLACERGLKWPVLTGAGGAGLLTASIWLPTMLRLVIFLCGLFLLFGAINSVLVRIDVVLSKKNGRLEVRPVFAGIRLRPRFVLKFSEIREFLLEPEFELGSIESQPFVWHLAAITNDGESHRLTWNFNRQPVRAAGEEAARISGKPLREESDPLRSSTWGHWGYNFLR